MAQRLLIKRMLAAAGAACAFAAVAFGLRSGPLRTYSLAAIALLTCSIAWIKANGDSRKNIVLTLCSIMISVYAAEFALHHVGWTAEGGIGGHAQPAANSNGDPRAVWDVIRDLAAQGLSAVPFVPPQDFVAVPPQELFPLGGVASSITVFCNEHGPWRWYLSDRHGFNNPDAVFKGGEFDAVIIGDSFAQGVCVPCGEDIGGAMRRRGISTVNLGMAGSGPLVELGILKEYAQRLKPKFVFWLFYENDVLDLQRELGSSILKSYLKNGFLQNLVDRQNEVDDLLRSYIERPRVAGSAEKPTYGTASWLFLRNVRTLLKLPLSSADKGAEAEVEKIVEIIKNARRFVRAWGGELVFVYLPSQSNITGKRLDPAYGRIVSALQEDGVPIIDMLEMFKATPDPLAFFPGRQYGHYNSLGYDHVAARLSDFVAQNIRSSHLP